jgi:hypothetical protein
MNVRRGMLRAWIVFGAVWIGGSAVLWYGSTSGNRAQLATLDECSKLYPPLPDGFVLDRDSCSAPPCTQQSGPWLDYATKPSLLKQFDSDTAWGKWETSEAKLRPQCAPRVGKMSLEDFIGLHATDRVVIRQDSADALRASTVSAVTYGLAVPAGLLTIGFVLGWVIQGFRSR